MIISPEHALDLLRKWFDEKTLLKVMISPHEELFCVCLMGYVVTLADEGIVISDNPDRNQRMRHYIELNPKACEFYDYLETKDLKGQTDAVKQYLAERHGIAGLSIVLLDKTRLSFFEQA